jgi:hypothetical protein
MKKTEILSSQPDENVFRLVPGSLVPDQQGIGGLA